MGCHALSCLVPRRAMGYGWDMTWQDVARRAPDIGRIAAIYAGATVAGWVAARLNVPLPWMIGAILFSIATSLTIARVRVPAVTRPIGQVVIAASVGLAFTPTALAALGDMLWLMVGAAVATIALGLMVAWVLVRLGGVDAITASLASVPMGPVESANLARTYGVDAGPVVFSQTIRILALVLLVPPVLIALEPAVTDPTAALRDTPWSAGGAVLLILCALVGVSVIRAVRLSNPFFLGAVGGSAVAAALSLPITAVPYPVLAAAQVLLGVWLGAVFDRDFFRRAGRFVPAAMLATALMIAACLVLGLALLLVSDVSWGTMVLATAPGSVTEMALTAKVLQEGVAVVTAFHVTRIFIILPTAPLLMRGVDRVTQWFGATR